MEKIIEMLSQKLTWQVCCCQAVVVIHWRKQPQTWVVSLQRFTTIIQGSHAQSRGANSTNRIGTRTVLRSIVTRGGPQWLVFSGLLEFKTVSDPRLSVVASERPRSCGNQAMELRCKTYMSFRPLVLIERAQAAIKYVANKLRLLKPSEAQGQVSHLAYSAPQMLRIQ